MASEQKVPPKKLAGEQSIPEGDCPDHNISCPGVDVLSSSRPGEWVSVYGVQEVFIIMLNLNNL